MLGGDPRALEELLNRHRQSCLRIAQSTIRNAADAEEEVQNALLRAWQRLGQCQEPSRFSNWLYRIVINQCLMRMRRDRTMRGEPLEERSLWAASEDPSPESRVQANQMQEGVRREVRRLPRLLRDPLILSELEERPLREVADRLGITVPAAKSRVLRARTEMRRRIERAREVGQISA